MKDERRRVSPQEYFVKKLPVHPAFHTAISIKAIEGDVSKQEVLHGILCEVFDRPDLIGVSPLIPQATAASA